MMDAIDKEFIEYYSVAGRALGLGDMPATVIALLYIEPGPVAMEDLSRKTGYSLASISNMMRMLEAVGAVKRIKKPGTRKAYFYMEKDLLKINRQKLSVAYESGIKPALEMLPPIIMKYKKLKKDERTAKKYAIVENYYRQMTEFEKTILRWIEDLDRISAVKARKAGNP